MEKTPAVSNTLSLCFHCGDTIRGERIEHEGKNFCCSGCKVVYEILQQNDLCTYYSIQQSPGNSPATIEISRFAFLDDETIQKQLLDFSDGKISRVTFSLPTVHCSSCIWLLEQLYKLDAGIVESRVEYLKKKVSIKFLPAKTSLKNIVILLTSIGYEPELQLDAAEKKMESEITRSLYYKIGVAGFCFGNAMLFSFPEYLGVDATEEILKTIFSYLNLLLGVPVFFYCSKDYFASAIGGLKKKIINIDVPIALGILLLFGRSAYEILTQTGPGFIDSMCGLLFFLLLGRIFQSKTYDRLNFERNYKSYFPLSVTTKRNGIETTVPIASLKRGNRIVIRHGEIIPADALLLQGNAAIDYSFVTGEATPVEKVLGEIIYAGGKQVGGVIELEVTKEVSQSYLTQLWNNFNHSLREQGQLSELSNSVSKYFTIIVLGVSLAVLAYWLSRDVTTAINAFTGILIVACPCALAISIPFTLGTTLRIFGKNDFYLKNTAVIELLSRIDTIVFDKTGTITHAKRSSVDYVGTALSDEEIAGVY
ncbi:MAG: heavy metal translocating P-type ATPase metal-binding domain-containing protein, partial [Bacteroidota bacterium]